MAAGVDQAGGGGGGPGRPLHRASLPSLGQVSCDWLTQYSPLIGGRMGNLRGWGGPLSSSWHRSQVALQVRILARMRGLGMVPVLPAFAGQVPEAVTRLHPGSSFTRQTWLGFNSSYNGGYLLSPLDPLFPRIGEL